MVGSIHVHCLVYASCHCLSLTVLLNAQVQVISSSKSLQGWFFFFLFFSCQTLRGHWADSSGSD